MKIMITDSKGDSISITIGDNGSFRELNKRLEKGQEMRMDFTNLEKGDCAELDQKTAACLPGNANDRQRVSLTNCSENSSTSNLQLLEDQVKSCLNQIRVGPGDGSDIKQPNIKVSISSENNETSKSKSLCRLCANRRNDMVYMFGSSGLYKNIIDKIEDCLPIMITETDTLPKEACRSCLEKLELCHEFHRTVAEAEKHFLIQGGKVFYNPAKMTKYCQTISDGSRTRIPSTVDENCCNLNEKSVSQARLSTSYSPANSPICVPDSEDESSLAERISDSKKTKFGNNERKKANKREDIHSREEAKGKTVAAQIVHSKVIKCQICGKGFETIQKCCTHSKIHITDNYYPCSLCDEIFTVEKEWSEHSMEHKEDNKGFDKEGETHSCGKCGKKFITEARLQFHKNYHDPNAKPCYCQLCDTTLDSESALYQHLQTVHGQFKEFRCEICGKQFRAQASVNAHQRKHRYIRSFECTVCNKRFYSKDTLEMHKETHSNEKNFSCLHCGESFAQKLPLTLHMQSHTDGQSQTCDSGEKTSTGKTDRDNHRRSDPGNRPFKCTVCERTFDHSARLREHSSVHTGKRPYTCSLCGKSFKRANARKVHMIIHTGEKPYRCDLCGTNFRRAGDMRRHKKTQHRQNE